MRAVFFLLLAIVCFSCDPPAKPQVASPPATPSRDSAPDTISPAKADTVPHREVRSYSPAEQQLLDSGLTDIYTLDSTFIVDLRYSTDSNFLGMDVYGDLDKAFLQPEIAKRLLLAEKALQEKHPGYSLIIYDAVRPMRIQRLMWDTLDLPRGQKQKYLSNPANGGSLHNYGAAVDVSIADENGRPLDMGTPYDFFGEKAHPVLEKTMLDSGILTLQQIHNRELLRSVMKKGGFWNIQTEWWHFNACTRAEAMERYRLVE